MEGFLPPAEIAPLWAYCVKALRVEGNMYRDQGFPSVWSRPQWEQDVIFEAWEKLRRETKDDGGFWLHKEVKITLWQWNAGRWTFSAKKKIKTNV